MNGLICLFKQVAGGSLGVIAAGVVIPLAATGSANPVEQVWMWLLVPTIIAVVVANVWGRKTGRPSSIVLIPANVLLVSGSIGFRGLLAMAGGELMLGAQQDPVQQAD